MSALTHDYPAIPQFAAGEVRKAQQKKQTKTEITPELLFELRTGNHEAFKTVYFRFYKYVFRFLHTLTRSEYDAEEITQNVFVTLWEKRNKIDPLQGLNGYMFTIAKNSALKYLMEKKNANAEFDALAKHISPEGDETTDDSMIIRDTELLIDIAIARMPKPQGKVFEMSYKQGLSNEEIAEKFGMAGTSVATHLHVARDEVKELIALFILILSLA